MNGVVGNGTRVGVALLISRITDVSRDDWAGETSLIPRDNIPS